MSKRIAILGSTGSIGCNAAEVIQHLGAPYRATALSAHSNAEPLIAQAAQLRPSAVALTGECDRDALESRLHHLGCETFFGQSGLVELVRHPEVDVVLSAVVGAAGLPAAVAAVEVGKTLLLANKEALVVAGSLLMPRAREANVPLLPIDSEHSAIFQAMLAGRRSEVRRVFITASGGPFRTASVEQMEHATPADALKHPTWTMGSKITIDSATMFNKALEIIEAVWLFDLDPSQIEVVVHPESIIHSMVDFVDGSVIAQLSPPDMRTPIQYALTYPERRDGTSKRIDFSRAMQWRFEPPDFEKFPALRLAFEVCQKRGTLGAVMNAANEVAVQAFLAGTVRFGMIWRIVERTMQRHTVLESPSLAELLEADRWARQAARDVLGELTPPLAIGGS
ncbi:MAG: 1-deoxy-D-xylulose-5-phosphate reductoisomerase [Tepidisphaeraceae bacterium]